MDVKPAAPGLHNDQWLDLTDISLNSLGAHVLFGEINEDSVGDTVAFLLKANHIFPSTKELTLLINTLGGDCASGFALIDLMEISRLPIRTIGTGNIISMGVLIFAAGAKGRRLMTRNTIVMAHQFSDGVDGKFHELMATYKSNMYTKHQFIQHFVRHSTMTEQQIEEVMFGASDTWLTPTECKKFGIVDQIVDELPEFNLELPAPLSLARPVPQPPSSGSTRRPRSRSSGTAGRKTR